ncbi:MAG: MFS transporter [Thalassobaculales bacterium]
MATTIDVPRSDVKVIGLVCGAHMLSHVYMLLLPPLFPQLRDHFGVGFLELGLIVTAFNLASALTQAPMGFLVDRLGARTLLIAGLSIEGACFAAIGLVPQFWMVIALATLAGVANSVYHPCDYTILNASVAKERMGRAFSAHTFAGYLGFAAAPVAMLALERVIGWQGALMVGGGSGLVMAMILLVQGAVLQDRANAAAAARKEEGGKRGIAMLLTMPILMSFLFYVLQSMSNTGVTTFSVSALSILDKVTFEQATFILSLYLASSAGGVLVGGWLADKTSRHDLVSAGTYLTYGGLVALIGLGASGPVAIGVLLVIAGLASGINAPSRDMMVRAAAPAGAVGAVFGFVSVGFNVGGLIAPSMYGAMMDYGNPGFVFFGVAAASALCVVTVLQNGAIRRRRAAVAT